MTMRLFDDRAIRLIFPHIPIHLTPDALQNLDLPFIHLASPQQLSEHTHDSFRMI